MQHIWWTTTTVAQWTMTRVRWLLLASSTVLPACAGQTDAPRETATASHTAPPSFVGQVWIATDSSAAPGTLRIFLPDGTLVMDSCGETYRLVRWESLDGDRIAWLEDVSRIEADIARGTSDELRLRLRLAGGEVKDENYRLARVPYTCPDVR